MCSLKKHGVVWKLKIFRRYPRMVMVYLIFGSREKRQYLFTYEFDISWKTYSMKSHVATYNTYSHTTLLLMTSEFPSQRDSNAETVSIWWRHHGYVSNRSVVAWHRICDKILPDLTMANISDAILRHNATMSLTNFKAIYTVCVISCFETLLYLA